MKISLINPSYLTLASQFGTGHQIPLGLLMLGGPLLNTGREVRLWTDLGRQVRDHSVVQHDLSKWDYRHQVISQPNLSPSKIFLAVKWLELWFHARPGKLWAMLKTRNRFRRQQLMWSSKRTALVWLAGVSLWKTTRSFKKSPSAFIRGSLELKSLLNPDLRFGSRFS
jgi:hypothetical protein